MAYFRESVFTETQHCRIYFIRLNTRALRTNNVKQQPMPPKKAKVRYNAFEVSRVRMYKRLYATLCDKVSHGTDEKTIAGVVVITEMLNRMLQDRSIVGREVQLRFHST